MRQVDSGIVAWLKDKRKPYSTDCLLTQLNFRESNDEMSPSMEFPLTIRLHINLFHHLYDHNEMQI